MAFNHNLIHNKENYIFFGDLDGFQKDINVFIGMLKNFLNDYYSNIHFVDYNSVVNTAMLMVIKGDGSEPPLFNLGINNSSNLSK